MTSRSLQVCLAVVGLCAIVTGAAAADTPPPAISTNVSPSADRSLNVEITNVSHHEITLRENRLPWKWRYAMIVKAFKADLAGTPLDEEYPFSDPVPRVITLAPGERLSGAIKLDARFPDLQGALRETDVLILWSYVPEATDAMLPRSAGVVILPRTKTGGH